MLARFLGFVLALTPAALGAAGAPPERFVLGNGVHGIVVVRPGDSRVQAGWVMAVGSANERPGETGQARLVARLLDDGTRTVGTRDADRERALLIEADGLRARRPWTTERAAVDTRLGEIDRELAALQDLGAFRRHYEDAGLTPPRSAVSEDATVFSTELPPAELERWFRLETERLRAPVFRRVSALLDDGRAEWQAEQALNLAALPELRFRMSAWEGHPYAWPPAGLVADLSRITRHTLESFHQTQYGPDRLTFVLVGPLDPKAVRELAERSFGTLPARTRQPPVVAASALRPGERAVREIVEAVPRLLVEYRTPGAAAPESEALLVLARVLGGTAGRLQRAVNAAGQNASARVVFEPRKELGRLRFEIAARVPGPDAANFLTPLDQELERLRSAPVTAEELAAARAAVVAEITDDLADSRRLAARLLADAGRGEPEQSFGLAARLARITPADLQRVATATLRATERTVGVFQPSAAVSPAGTSPGATPKPLIFLEPPPGSAAPPGGP